VSDWAAQQIREIAARVLAEAGASEERKAWAREALATPTPQPETTE
jgi:hypothetical protein